MAEQYLYGQGKLKLALITAGVVGAFRFVGDVSSLSLAFAETKAEHRESYSGKKSKVREFNITNDMTLSATFHDFNNDNLALFTQGTGADTVAGTVTDEVLPAVVAGDEIILANPGVSSVVITDSADPAVTIDPSHYTVEAQYGNVLFNTLPTGPAPTQPLNAAYSYAARKSLTFLSATQKQVALRYEGINLAEGGAPIIVELYKLSPGLLQELALITDGNALAGMSVSGSVLLDSSKTASGAFGQYGRIVQLDA